MQQRVHRTPFRNVDEATGWNLEQNVIVTAINERKKHLRACVRAEADMSNITCKQLHNWTIG